MPNYSPIHCHICGSQSSINMIAVETNGVRLFRCESCAVDIHKLIMNKIDFDNMTYRLLSVFFRYDSVNPRWRGENILDEYFNHVSRKAKCWPWNILDGETQNAATLD